MKLDKSWSFYPSEGGSSTEPWLLSDMSAHLVLKYVALHPEKITWPWKSWSHKLEKLKQREALRYVYNPRTKFVFLWSIFPTQFRELALLGIWEIGGQSSVLYDGKQDQHTSNLLLWTVWSMENDKEIAINPDDIWRPDPATVMPTDIL